MADLKDTSKKAYESNLKRLRDSMGQTDNKFLINAVAVIKAINDYKQRSGEPISDKTKKIYLSSARYGLMQDNSVAEPAKKAALEAYKAVYDKLVKGIEAKRLSTDGGLTEKELGKFVPWEKLKEATRRMEAQYKEGKLPLQDLIIAKLYTDTGVVMRADYANLKVLRRQPAAETGNYLLLTAKKGTIVLNNYKTSEKYGPKTIALPDDLTELIRKHMAETRNTVLLVNRYGMPVTENALGKTVARIFKAATGKNAGISQIRHAYATFLNKDLPSEAELHRRAELLGHSVEMNQAYRRTGSE